VHLVSWKWSEYSSAIMFTGMIISAAVLKIIFHHLDWLARILPESCVLIVVGVMTAIIIHYVILDDVINANGDIDLPFPVFTSELFFNVLLPPIILDSALALYDRDFFDNFVSIMIFAIFGTLLNVFSIGYSLYGLSAAGLLGEFKTNETGTMVEHVLKPTECLIFSSLISAVDPVAVLAIFEEIHVHLGLYFLVFGESLFNDGVTVVLYNTMNALLNVPEVGIKETFMAILSFFFVAFGGAVIGAVNGVFASYITTFTKHVRIVEPLIIFSTAYFAFLQAELVHWSGIISIIAYGITVKKYGFQNLGRESYTTVKYAIKTLASTSDCIIFLFLGVVLIAENHNFHVGFITATILLCLVFRFVGTFLFSAIVNLRRVHKIEFTEQIIMGYGGLRGAVGFSLAVVLEKDVWYRELFVSAALAMVFFTVFLQGSTIKLLVKCLKIRLEGEEEKLITHDIQENLIDNIMNGMETIVGKKTKATGWCEQAVRALDHGLKNLLIVEETKTIFQKYEEIMLDEHFTNLYAPRIIAKQETEDKPTPSVSLQISRKTFKNGLKSSNWEKFKSHTGSEGPDLLAVVDQLQQRRDRAKTMESRILRKDIETNGNVEKEAPDGGKNSRIALNRSASTNWASLRRASQRSAAIKAEYEKVQEEKRVYSPRATPIREEEHGTETDAFLFPPSVGVNQTRL